MQNPDHLPSVIREWVQKAENDLKTAAHVLNMAADPPTDAICFHAQQRVEKYLKALLLSRGKSFPKTHDVEQLLALLPAQDRPQLSGEEQDKLTDYATAARYPGDYEPIPVAEARRSVAIARRVRKQIRRSLPKQALPRRHA